MAHVYQGERTFLHPVLRPVERLIYRSAASTRRREMGVLGYVVALLVFNFVACCSSTPSCACRATCR